MEEINFRITVKDYVRANQLYYKDEIFITKTFYLLLFIYCVALTVMAQRILFWPSIGIGLSFILFFYDKYYYRILGHLRITKIEMYKDDIHVILNEREIQTRTPSGESVTNKVFKIVISKNMILILPSPSIFLILPKRAFESESNYSNAIKLLENFPTSTKIRMEV